MKAEKRARAESEEAARLLPEKTTVQFDRTENRIDIRTDATKKLGRNRNVSITYTVRAPEAIDLELKSVNGSVQAKDVSGAVDAKTTNGRIGLTGIIGAIQAGTTNGNIGLAEVLGPIMAKTTNGGIKVALSGIDDEPHDIRAGTVNGNIDTDFPVTVKGRFSKSVDGVINGGGRLIH